jgi:two-component system, chemotaxis family, protein-glutamate methylesterase/glutaminase
MATKNFHIAGIGCSAGCLDNLRAFFQHIPQGTGIAYVVIQHLIREQHSSLNALLAKHSRLPITRVTKDVEIHPDHIYLITEDIYLEIEDYTLKVIPRPEDSKINRAVNIFFKSLAVHSKEKTIGIILSGAGADGLEGVEAIEREGGTIYVQDPDSAAFKGMPVAAIVGDHPDEVMPPAQLAKMIAEKHSKIYIS